MCDESQPNLGLTPYTDLNRRRFAAIAGATAATLGGSAKAQGAVTEQDVRVRTPDGTCDAKLLSPSGRGQWPGVLIWPDAGGLRPVSTDMGRRLAGQGYVVLVVNPYYRTGDVAYFAALPQAESGPKRNAARAAHTPEAIDRDAKAFVAFLDGLPQTSNAKVGVQGYCMGGPFTIRTAAAVPNRIGAVGSFHGGNLVTKEPTSPHLLIGKTKARYLFAIAKGDDARDPEFKGVLRTGLYRAGLPGLVEVFGGNHGWCVPDNSVYDQAEAERAWAKLSDLYRQSLV